MASIGLDEIYSRFYLRVKDYDMVGLDEKIVNEMLGGYLRSTLSKPMVRRLFSQITMDEALEEVEFEMREPWDEDSDIDFVVDVLSLGMLVAWVDPRYHSTLLTNQMLSNSEQKWYNQKDHMNELKNMYIKAQIDLRKLIRDRGYSLSAINGVES